MSEWFRDPETASAWARTAWRWTAGFVSRHREPVGVVAALALLLLLAICSGRQ